jgi:tetratricopeptide (TPR) repeat protein
LPDDRKQEGAVSEWREDVGAALRAGSTAVLLLVLIAAPLLAGSVHRPTATVVLLAVAVAFAASVAGQRLRSRGFRGSAVAHFGLLFVLIPLVQSVPLPASLRGHLDPAGTALLANAPEGPPAAWPLSLDPLATRQEIGTAAAALAVFVLALNVAARRARAAVLVKAVAITGGLGVIIGVVHRLFGIEGLYGFLPDTGGVLPGPLINANHAAELYELAAFAALAIAVEATVIEARIGYYALAAINAAAALATLSRGSVLALVAGLGTFALLRAPAGASDDAPRVSGRRRKALIWLVMAVGLVVAAALALGAGAITEEVAKTDLGQATEKPALWKDSLPLARQHPAGIGRRAFARVYPAYKTLLSERRFEFVENAPLQLLIDLGWLGMGLVGASLFFLVRQTARRRSRDDVEAALVAALVAVGTHNLVDFGLEVPGIRLPLAALAGALVGRTYGRDLPRSMSRAAVLVAVTVFLGLGVGVAAELRTSGAEREAAWKATAAPAARKQIAVEAARAFPTDYFYPLLQAADEPLVAGPQAGARSPKLGALNRALRLCPGCPPIHRELARTLFRAGRRAQALAAWRDLVRVEPLALPGLLGELDALGFKPAELATLAVGDRSQILTVASYLVPKKANAEVAALVAEARARAAPPMEIIMVEAALAGALGDLVRADRLLAQAKQSAPTDPRPHALHATIERQAHHLDLALAHEREASRLAPGSIQDARWVVGLVIELHRWQELEEALDGLKTSLQMHGASIVEVFLQAGLAQETRGNFARALMEYKNAVLLEPRNVAGWVALGRVREATGDLDGAVEAYETLTSLLPADPRQRTALERVTKARQSVRLRQQLLP